MVCEIFRGDPLETAVLIAATYELRRSEICGLRWCAVDFEKKEMLIHHTAIDSRGTVTYDDTTKSKASRRVFPVGDSLLAHFKVLREKQESERVFFGVGYFASDYICRKGDGTLITPTFLSHHYARVIKKRGLPYVHLHGRRHSVATMLHEAGRDLKDVQG